MRGGLTVCDTVWGWETDGECAQRAADTGIPRTYPVSWVCGPWQRLGRLRAAQRRSLPFSRFAVPWFGSPGRAAAASGRGAMGKF